MRISLFQTTTFRITVFASLAFMLLGIAGLRVLYWSMLSVIDQQIDSALSREYADMTAAYTKGQFNTLRLAIANRASPHDDAVRIYLLRGSDGSLIGNLAKWPSEAPEVGHTADIHVEHAAGSARVSVLAFADGSRLLVGRALTERGNFIHAFEGSAIAVLIADLLLGIAAAMLLGRYARMRLTPINATAEEVLGGNLLDRIAVGDGGDEYDTLARNINAMLARIQKLVDTVRGVTEHIAHDLRTPLNRLRGRLEVALMAERTPEEYRAVIERAIAESETIVDVFNGILKIARIESGTLALQRNPVDLAEVMEELVDLYQAFAEEAGITIVSLFGSGASPPEAGTSEAGAFVLGDGHLISQVAANLLDNAIKYSPRGSRVTISAVRRDDCVGFVVSDHGPGIPPEKRTLIQERFVRLEAGSDKQGYGLGLSFAAAVARWHGAQLLLEDNEPGLKVSLLFCTAPTATKVEI